MTVSRNEIAPNHQSSASRSGLAGFGHTLNELGCFDGMLSGVPSIVDTLDWWEQSTTFEC